MVFHTRDLWTRINMLNRWCFDRYWASPTMQSLIASKRHTDSWPSSGIQTRMSLGWKPSHWHLLVTFWWFVKLLHKKSRDLMIHVRRMTLDFSFICFGIEYNRCASCFLTLSISFLSPFVVAELQMAWLQGWWCGRWGEVQGQVCGSYFLFFSSPLFDFSNLYNWSLLHERYLPIRHKTGTSSDAQICGSMVFVREIRLSGRELLPVTAWFKLVTIIITEWLIDVQA